MDILSKLQLNKNPINEIEESRVAPHMLLYPVGSRTRSLGYGVWSMEYGHSAADDMVHLGVRRIEKWEKNKGRIKVTLDMIVASKNRRYNLQQTPGEFEPNH
jgi:hypothetical protein